MDFARSHPGGSLGRRLLLHIGDIMHSGNEVPSVSQESTLSEALVEMTNKGLGMTAVVDAEGRVCGIYTDGDLRRTLDRDIDLRNCKLSEVMTTGGKTAEADMLAAEALKIMQENKINALLITDREHRLV